MIEITESAANMIKRSLVEGKVIRMFLAAIDATGANYGLALGDVEKGDKVFESRGVKVYMSPEDTELLSETIIDYVDDDREPVSSFGDLRMKSQVVDPALMSIAASMITAVVTTTTANADTMTATAVAASCIENFYINYIHHAR